MSVSTGGGTPDLTARSRPLSLGLAIGHPTGTAGSIGPFVVTASGRPGLMSTASVLAPPKARIGDYIHQPGPRELSTLTGATRAATLAQLPGPDGRSLDAAIAELLDGVDWRGNIIPAGFPGAGALITGPAEAGALAAGDTVAFIGRTSGYSTGTISATDVDNLTMQTAYGPASFSGCIEVVGASHPFSRAGDGGALVYRVRDLVAVGLIFAAAHADDGTVLTYVQPLAPALAALGARLA